MSELIIVDGYNIIDGWPELAAIKNRSLQRCREELCRHLEDYAAYHGCEVWAVFSGQFSGRKRAGQSYIGQTRVFFTRSGEGTAATLERLARTEAQERSVRIITNSRVKGRSLMGENITITSGDVFRMELQEVSRRMRELSDSGEEWRYSPDD